MPRAWQSELEKAELGEKLSRLKIRTVTRLPLSVYKSSPVSLIMASVAAGLFSALPKPKYTGEDEEVPVHAQPKGPRIVGPGVLDESQIVLKVSSSRLVHRRGVQLY